jgi:hypothetical protein
MDSVRTSDSRNIIFINHSSMVKSQKNGLAGTPTVKVYNRSQGVSRYFLLLYPGTVKYSIGDRCVKVLVCCITCVPVHVCSRDTYVPAYHLSYLHVFTTLPPHHHPPCPPRPPYNDGKAHLDTATRPMLPQQLVPN